MSKVLHTEFDKKWTGCEICIKNSSKVKPQYTCYSVHQRLSSASKLISCLTPRVASDSIRISKKGQEKTAKINTLLLR